MAGTAPGSPRHGDNVEESARQVRLLKAACSCYIFIIAKCSQGASFMNIVLNCRSKKLEGGNEMFYLTIHSHILFADGLLP